jgi:hypothetical protein
MGVPTLAPFLVTPGRIALSDPEKAEAFEEKLEAQYQPIKDPMNPAFEMVDEVF